MKALTVRQPWASLIIAGVKDVENRTWRTSYRGRLLIHAGRGRDTCDHEVPDDLPGGVILGSVTLLDCVRDHPSPWSIPASWHWLLGDVQPWARPVPVRGQLGLWDASTVLAAARH